MDPLTAKLVARAAKKGLQQLAETIKDPEEALNRLIKLGLCIIAPIAVILFIPISLLSLPGIFANEERSNVEYDVNSKIEETATYKKIRELYVEYQKKLEKSVIESIQKIEADNTIINIIPMYPADPIVEIKVPEIIKTINLESPKIQYVLAYIGVKNLDMDHMGEIQIEDPIISKKEVFHFLDTIVMLQEQTVGSEPIYYYASTKIMDLEEIAEKFFTQQMYGNEYIDRQQQFIISCESYGELVEEDEIIRDSENDYDLSMFTIYATGMAIPQYLQYDSRWGKVRYGNGTISDSGCATTSFAMVASYFSKSFISPIKTANFSDNNGCFVVGAGTSWSFFQIAAQAWNLQCTNLGKSVEKIIEKLQAGEPIIASMGPGTFTKGGHMIILRGMTADGKILVVDPNDSNGKRHYEREFDMSLVLKEGKNFWSFRKK